MPYDDSGNWYGAGADPMTGYDKYGDYTAPKAITDAGYYSNSPGIISNNQWTISGKEYEPGKMGKTYWQVSDPQSIARAKALKNADLVNIGNNYYLSTSDPNFRTILPQTEQGTSGFGELFSNGIGPLLAAYGAGQGLSLLGGTSGAAAGTAGAESAGAGAGSGAGAVGGDLSGSLASPSSVSNFLSTVPEATPGTTLPIGGSELDITAPGAVGAATAAGNALGPGSGTPSLLPGGGGTTPIAPPTTPVGTPLGTPAPTPAGTTAAPTPAAPAPISNATAPVATGSPVGGAGAPGVPGGGTPGLPAPVEDLSRAASAADKARLAPGVVDKALNAITKNPLTAAGIGVNVLSQINARKQGKQLDQQLRASAAPASSVANQLISEGLSGKPSASAAFDISKWTQATKSAIRQRYANMGRDPSNDSAAAKELADVDAKAVAMRDAAAQGLLQGGLNAAQIAQGPTTQAALAAAQQDKELGASIANTLTALGQLQAMSSRGAGAAP